MVGPEEREGHRSLIRAKSVTEMVDMQRKLRKIGPRRLPNFHLKKKGIGLSQSPCSHINSKAILEVEIEMGVHEMKNLFGKNGKKEASSRMQGLTGMLLLLNDTLPEVST